MNSLNWLFDICFPPRESTQLIQTTVRTGSLLPYTPNTWNNSIYLSSYADPVVQAVITEQKFYANKDAQQLLADLLTRWYQEQAEAGVMYFMPIPLSRTRARERGHNQVESTLKQVVPNTKIIGNVLTRQRDTVPQTSLPRTQRLHNLKGAFACNPKKLQPLPDDARVVLVDDVITTGATIQAARAVLAPHIKTTQTLTCLAFAH